jgi:hypothetical protein
MAYRLSTDTRNKACDAIVDDLDAGSGAGTIAIRTGTQPTNVGDADTGTNADNSGTAGHARLKDSDGNIHSDCTCGQGSGDISFDNNVIVSGGTVAISSMSVTMPIS